MSEEILKALMQLFAIIAKQDYGATEVERNFVKEFLVFQLSEDLVNEYLELYDKKVGKPLLDEEGNPMMKPTSVKDSVKTLGFCKKINKTLTQKQKVVVLVRILELMSSDNKFTEQRMEIIDTVAEVFMFDKVEFAAIVDFCRKSPEDLKDVQDIMVINSEEGDWGYECKHISSKLDGNITILKVVSEDLYFLKYAGTSEIYLNGLPVNTERYYLFATGSTVKMPGGKPVYYSDVVANFMADGDTLKLSFNADNVDFKFPNGAIGLNNINISEESGKLVGLMGASGAGKTTLLNVLSGIEEVSSGQVLINGVDINKEKDKIKGIIGYIPQDDLLIEELTVFENLFYNAKLCFNDLNDIEITELANKVLNDLGLFERKDLKVGNPLEKTISGGQRKRLNIGLELIREPSVLFVDEPTSGLSSRDSENVMDLLRELTLKGKLIFVVIHQPSSDIYKMFDKIIFLDVGGYQIYYGNPVEAVVYFKQADHQANADQGQCLICGNVNPEIIFNIIESKVVDDYGNYTKNRKTTPEQWVQLYKKQTPEPRMEDIEEAPPLALNIPSWIKQLKIFTTRDFYSKISNTQYLLINLLEAPLLAFLLAFIIRFVEKAGGSYIFRSNENIPAFIFMSIIVMLFIGLTVSAEEIFKDQRILKREKFLNLSKSSYLVSKLAILFTLSAIQSLLFVWVGNYIVGIQSMYFDYWLMLFTVSCFANLLGLNISASFNSAVTIYILIPLFVIPQMILGGAMFSFSKLNRTIGGGEQNPPFIAEMMVSRWAFEGLMVNQFVKNPYGNYFYNLERKESITNFKQVYYLPKLQSIIEDSRLLLPKEEVVSEVEEIEEEVYDEEGDRYAIPKIVSNDLFDFTSVAYYSDGEPIPFDPTLPNGLFYKVQVGAYTKNIPNDFFSSFAPQMIESTDFEVKRYTTGFFKTYDNATIVKDELVEMDYNDAFIVPFIDRERVSIEEALNYEEASVIDEEYVDDQEEKQVQESDNAVVVSGMSDSVKGILADNLLTLRNEIDKEMKRVTRVQFEDFDLLTVETFDAEAADRTKDYLKALSKYYTEVFTAVNAKKSRKVEGYRSTPEKAEKYERFKENFQNNYLNDILFNSFEKNKILVENNQITQVIDPIFKSPEKENLFNFRTHFYAPEKFFAGNLWTTFSFNVIIIWLMTLLLYVALYFDLLKRTLDGIGAYFIRILDAQVVVFSKLKVFLKGMKEKVLALKKLKETFSPLKKLKEKLVSLKKGKPENTEEEKTLEE